MEKNEELRGSAGGGFTFDQAITLSGKYQIQYSLSLFFTKTFKGFGLYNWTVLLASGLVFWGCIGELMSASILVPAARCDLELIGGTEQLLLAMAFIGKYSSQ